VLLQRKGFDCLLDVDCESSRIIEALFRKAAALRILFTTDDGRWRWPLMKAKVVPNAPSRVDKVRHSPLRGTPV
jgi:hypothetical protein